MMTSFLLTIEDPIPWHAARAAGVVTYLMLWFSTVSGLASSSRIGRMMIPAAEVFDIHSFTAYLTMIALGVHIVSLLGDGWLSIPVSWVLVPGASDYRTFAVAAGVAAAYVAIAITVSFSLRQRLGVRNWRRLHYVAFPAYGLALLHGVYAGTDSSTVWGQSMYLSTASVLLFLVFLRILGGAVPNRPVRKLPDQGVIAGT